MEQRLICLFLGRRELSARTIHNELTNALGADAIAYLTVTLYPWQGLIPTILVEAWPGDSPNIIIDHAILKALENQPFSSVWELAKLTCIPTAPVYRHSTQSVDLW
jgi:hypothetical protein